MPPSPTSKATYKNKDGSKFITLPKTSPSVSASEASPTMPQSNVKSSGAPSAETTTTVNRKKQKRREKQAAKLVAEQSTSNGINGKSRGNLSAPRQGPAHGSQFQEVEPDDSEVEEDGESINFENGGSINGQHISKNKKKKKSRPVHRENSNSNHIPPPPPPPESSSNLPRPGMTREKIWNTSSAEERERIKEFWLSLGEDERKALVKVEKDAVLKKMKEQQKHSCSCTVCGRKRLAIEEELEVLYDAYYDELEQYANHRQGDPPMMRGPRRLGAMSGFHSPHQLPTAYAASRGTIETPAEEDMDEDGEEEYSEDDEELDEYSEDEPPEVRSHATDFFNFGNSLTVKAGGILTVADDLLKNDGKKFIEMMEQLAERRMQREEEAERQFTNGSYHPNGAMPPHHHSHGGHNHPPPPPQDEEYDDDEEEDDEEEYGSEEDYDDDEMDSMTEEQRMEEGRRMFQIFAARMFEQRVLTAYKEKVAKERQQKLLEELDEESQADAQRKAKKAKEAQKRKDKNQQKKQALAEEKAKREAEEAEKLAAQQAIEEKKAEEQRIRQEEKRKKREAQKKAEEEERLRKEAEKQKRIQEQRDRQVELERKQREAKEREKKEKEEARLKALEAKEAKEREARGRKEKQEKERKEKEAKAREAQKQAEKQKKLDEQAAQAEREGARKKTMSSTIHSVSHQPAKRLPQQPISIPIPPGLQQHPLASPQVQVVMPIVPKAPTPVRPRTISQQHDSMFNVTIPQTPQFGANQSHETSPAPSTPQQNSPSILGSGSKPYLHHPQANSPIHAALRGSPGPMLQGLPAGMHPMAMNGFPPAPPMGNQMFPGSRMHYDPNMFSNQPINNQYRPPPGMPLQQHAPPPMPPSRVYPYGPPGFSQQPPSSILQSFSPSKENSSTQSHSRNVSGSFESAHGVSNYPIAKPTPIGRPSSIVHGQRSANNHRLDNKDMDELSNHLGSSALIDDLDEPFTTSATTRRSSVAPGLRGGGFSNGSSFMDQSYGSWSHSSNPFGGSSLPGPPTWGNNNAAAGWGHNMPPLGSAFSVNSNSTIRNGHPRPVTIRLTLCKICKNLASKTPDGFIEMSVIQEQLNSLFHEDAPAEIEILEICETEGNPLNGGGIFDVRTDSNGLNSIKLNSRDEGSDRRVLGAPGEIGSPIVGGGGLAFHRGNGGFGPPGGL